MGADLGKPRVRTDYAEHSLFWIATFDQPPERRYDGIVVAFGEPLDRFEVRPQVASLSCEAIGHEEQASRSVVGLGLDRGMARWLEGEIIVTQQEVFMPPDDAVADLVALLGAMTA
jgi:hypothetical protein